MAEPPDEAGITGPQPPKHRYDGGGTISLLNLPQDIFLGILDQLRPDGPLTTYESRARRPIGRPSHVECRTSLLNACLASKELYGLVIPCLYRNSLIRDRRELFHFFRTLARRPDRRPMVRSFAWVGILRGEAVKPGSSAALLHEEATMIAERWNSIKDEWPCDRLDHDIAELLKINGPDTLKDCKLLGAVLALCPRIKWLFMRNGGTRGIPLDGFNVCPESDAVTPFLRRYVFGESRESQGSVRPYDHHFLQDLQSLTIDDHNGEGERLRTEIILAGLFLNSPLLRRLEVKHPPHFAYIKTNFRTPGEDSKPLAENVEEVLVFCGDDPQDDMSAIVAFPKLRTLRAEFRDGSASPLEIFSFPHPRPRIPGALLNVSKTLETLCLTTSPETYPAEGRWESKTYPSSLSTLNQMTKLKDLTTECIWLFGSADPAVALQLPHLLPPSLARLHLIDYWGNSNLAEFYPEFPDGWSVLDFYVHVFQALRNECQVYNRDLKEVTFASNYLTSHAEATAPFRGRFQDETEITQARLQILKVLFSQVGVIFNVLTHEESTAMIHARWANIG
ncbi:hypothetical protein FJTKL_08300 [Diaporthe vaccinii]|uniref:F-box domain-containing protein n=1 Tax=Diaporthe vaccinii TaxID=105482 RepID=A0ABR4ESG5_9PEZI